MILLPFLQIQTSNENTNRKILLTSYLNKPGPSEFDWNTTGPSGNQKNILYRPTYYDSDDMIVIKNFDYL